MLSSGVVPCAAAAVAVAAGPALDAAAPSACAAVRLQQWH